MYVYLPPQYFRKAYANYRFPAIELLHGSPGQPSAWVNVMNVVPIYLNAMASGKATPAVLVMPDTDGGQQYGLQCLNDPGGLQDMTYVAQEVPDWAVANLRVQRPGRRGASRATRRAATAPPTSRCSIRTWFGYAGSLSGYFAPVASQVPADGKAGGKPIDVNEFAHNKRLLEINSPDEYIRNVPVGVPQFFLAAGAADVGDVQKAETSGRSSCSGTPTCPLDIVSGGGHQAKVWRAALTPMFDWMTPGCPGRSSASRRSRLASSTRHTTRTPLAR